MKMNVLMTHLHKRLNSEIEQQFRRGRVLSTVDVGYFLDRELEVYEDEHGDCFPADDFNNYIDITCKLLLQKKLIYTAGDRESYIENVRSHGLIASQEAIMRKALLSSKTAIVFQDADFPYDKNGMYIIR